MAHDASPTPARPAAHALAGVLATLLGMAAGHATAAFWNPAASPVLAVGSTVIDLTPTPLKELAVRTFGTYDKPLLVGGVVLATVALAALSGVLARRRPAVGICLLLLLVVLAGLAAAVRPGAGPAEAFPALAAGITGTAALVWLTRLLRSPSGQAVGTASSSAGPGRPGASRRGFLVAAGAVTASAAVLGAAGTWVARARTAVADFVLPRPARPAGDLPAGLEERIPGITPLRTPSTDFYRVDTKLAVPVVDVARWRLSIDGDVEQAVELSLEDLLGMPLTERDITLTCVSNEVGGRYVSGARWLGVPLRDLLDRAGVGGRADQILSTDVEGFTISTPLDVALDGRDTMVAVGMNGRPLPPEHGFPARLVTPGIYGYVGATKWLRRLTLTTYAAQQAYWTERGWATEAPIKVASRIDTPKPLSTIAAGRTAIGGIAWAQGRGIAAVEVRIDGGPWQPARLGPAVGVDYWRQWFLPWDAEPGRHLLAVRATTGDGEVQTSVPGTPFPEGASGVQEVSVTVS